MIDKLIKSLKFIVIKSRKFNRNDHCLHVPIKITFAYSPTSTPTTPKWFIFIVFMFQFLAESEENRRLNCFVHNLLQCANSTLTMLMNWSKWIVCTKVYRFLCVCLLFSPRCINMQRQFQCVWVIEATAMNEFIK